MNITRFGRGKYRSFLGACVVRVAVVPVGDKQADGAAFRDQICVDQEVGDTWWRALAKPGLCLTQILSLPLEWAAAELMLFSHKGKMLRVRVAVFRGFAGTKAV